jgi:SAM-dependent methyltransferase
MTASYDPIARDYDDLLPEPTDAAFYLRMAEAYRGPILDLGTGTGRVACALAARGHRVVGIDLSAEMLERARARQARLGLSADRLVFQHGDITAFDCHELFGLIVAPFSVLLELPGAAARTAAFACAARHLARDGALIFDCWFRGDGPAAGWGKPRPERIVSLEGLTRLARTGDVVAQLSSQTCAADGRMALTVFLDGTDRAERLSRTTYTWTRFYATPDEIRQELRAAGFGSVDLFGGFDGEPLLDPALEGRGRQVFVARRAGADR